MAHNAKKYVQVAIQGEKCSREIASFSMFVMPLRFSEKFSDFFFLQLSHIVVIDWPSLPCCSTQPCFFFFFFILASICSALLQSLLVCMLANTSRFRQWVGDCNLLHSLCFLCPRPLLFCLVMLTLVLLLICSSQFHSMTRSPKRPNHPKHHPHCLSLNAATHYFPDCHFLDAVEVPYAQAPSQHSYFHCAYACCIFSITGEHFEP